MTAALDAGGARDVPVAWNEWLEADGQGGFASGTASGLRTRRYNALLLCATQPPAGRVVLVNGVEAWIETAGRRQALTRQCYAPDLIVPADAARCVSFDLHPWPTWRLALDDGRVVRMACVVAKDTAETVLRWELEPGPGAAAVQAGLTLRVRPLLSGRDYHALHRENNVFDFNAQVDGQQVRWRPYGGLPAIVARTNGRYTQEPDWYRNFCYVRERERGLDDIEDLATPGVFAFDLAAAPAVMVLHAEDGRRASAALDKGGQAGPDTAPAEDALLLATRRMAAEAARRAAFASRLHRSADAYVVSRDKGLTLLAGFPWFTDWGRDTFIALRGLLLATGRLKEARDILLAWVPYLSEGMLPNRFPDDGGAPAYNAVDSALWFIVSAHEYLATGHAGPEDSARLQDACDAILAGYAAGTRHGIRADADGLLSAGCPGLQLTWMDAKVGDWVVTPRIGKPVEVQALWINALRIGQAWNSGWRALEQRATAAFLQRFPKPDGSGLYDVVDADHEPGRADGSIRPNQIFAVGGLPHAVLAGPLARAVLAQVERELWTPLGLRTLAPGDPGYIGHYRGGPLERDAAYHQGTAWPWLLGSFLQAWLRVRRKEGNLDATALARARERFLAPLLRHLDQAGLDHVSEVVDGDAPHRCGGTPFQAWSVGECLRMQAMLDELEGAAAGAE
ncbi:amylo-alpha-1,6-glucosidase [Bordetella flabilis]|uniref:Glycogen debranching protein n=1 Tax=Bordetella flabilis TaxID=463014 RepID=A0A193GHD0_9BORD|nr:amylo-alpha-1,6-glucosidase [Bordetella flabilis]ANN78694.1 glycogen debranching protein [Bordetella flabilis]